MRDPFVSVLAANAEADAVGALCANGWMRFYAADGAVLASLRFQAQAFHPAEDGTILSYPLAPDMSAAGGGNAVRFRCQTEAGEDVFGGSVGVRGEVPAQFDYEFTNSTLIHPGSEVHVAFILYSAWHVVTA